MKVASTIARYLLGLIFLIFGLNGFLNFIPMPPPTGLAAQFVGALFVSHYTVVVFLCQLIPAILLLINRYTPLALAILGPVIVNIFCFHAFLAPRSAVSGHRGHSLDFDVLERSFRVCGLVPRARTGEPVSLEYCHLE